MEKVIEIQQLTIKAKKKIILDKLDLDIYKNRINTILGPSGSGKSTLIRSINRLNDLNRDFKVDGKIYFDSQDVNTMNVVELRKKIGMVFQNPNPFSMSIYDNIAFGPRIHYKLSVKEMNALVEKSLTEAGLYEEVKDNLNKSALRLSGGQQQRLCIARALAVDPEVIMMDEPTTSLDPISKFKIEDLMLKLKEKYTVLLVTHDIKQAARVSDLVAFLYNGKIIEYGETNLIFENPKNKITESFITGRGE
jgi:phosphate transport system ATP-binding protein